jgi:hypothetical protein
MFRPLSPQLFADGRPRASTRKRRDLSHLRVVQTARRQVALELTAVVRDPELRVRLPMVSPVYTASA